MSLNIHVPVSASHVTSVLILSMISLIFAIIAQSIQKSIQKKHAGFVRISLMFKVKKKN